MFYYGVYKSVQVAVTKYHILDGLKNKLIYHSFRGCEVQDKGTR